MLFVEAGPLADDAIELLSAGVHLVVHEGEGELLLLGQLLLCGVEALEDAGFRLGAAAPEAAFQLLHGGRQQEDGGSPREHPADVGRAVDVDDQHHQLARLEALIHLFAEGAVVVAVVEVVLHHLVGVDEVLELLPGAVVVVHPLLLAGAGCAGGGGDGLFDLGVGLAQGLDHTILAGTGGTGDDKQVLFVFHFLLLLCRFSFRLARSAACHRLRRQGRKDYMVGVHDEHGPGAAAIGRINEHPPLPRLLHQTLDRRRVGTDDGHHPPCADQIAKADVDELHLNSSVLFLFKVLDLFADLLDLRLHVHHRAGDVQVLTLGADGVGLTVQLLSQEVQLAAHRLVQLQNGAVLGDVAAQTDGLLVHGGLVAEDGGFRQDAGVVDAAVLEDGLELLVEAAGVGFDAACAQGLHPAHPLLEEAQAALHVGLHLGTLGGAHGDEVVQRLSRHGGDVGPELFLVHVGVAGGQHVREAGQRRDGDVVLDAELLRKVPQGLLVAAGQLHVDGHFCVGGLHVLDGHAQLDLAAGDPLVELLFQAAVHVAAAAGDAGRILEIPGVDAAQLDRDLAAIQYSSPPAKTGHAQDHILHVSSLLMGGYADKLRYMYPRLGIQAHVTIHMLLFYSDGRFFASKADKKVRKPSQSLQSNDSSPKGGAFGRPGHFLLDAESPTWRKSAGLAYGASGFWTTHLVKLP